jgi:hypothetical protein
MFSKLVVSLASTTHDKRPGLPIIKRDDTGDNPDMTMGCVNAHTKGRFKNNNSTHNRLLYLLKPV